MGCSSSKATVAAPNEKEPETTASSPDTSAYGYGPKRRIPEKDVAAITKSGWRLEGPFKHSDHFPDADVASAAWFYSLLQQKAKSPKNIILYDIQSRMRYNRLSVKFAFCPWTGLPSKDLEKPDVVEEISKEVNATAKKKTVLLFSYSEEYKDDEYLCKFYNDFIAKAKPHQTIILEGSFAKFLERYPNAATPSPLTLPGPTEILYQAPMGFCLYFGEPTCCAALAWLTNGLYIETLIIFGGVEYQHADQFPNVRIVDSALTIGEACRECASEIRASSTRGTPVLVIGPDADVSAASIAWYMIEIGFSRDECVDYIAKRRDFLSPNTVFNDKILKALHDVEEGHLEKAAKAMS